MTLTIEIPTEVEAGLRHVADEKGQTVEEVVLRLAAREAALAGSLTPDLQGATPEERVVEFKKILAEMHERNKDLPRIPDHIKIDSEFIYGE